ncbi:MAG: hypothetical protein AAB548_00165 [Patescibacteria group bacterium]
MDLSTIYKPGEALGGRGANISALLSPLINNAIILTALASFAAVVFAGFNYITSSGDKAKVQQATTMLNYALLGLALAVSAFVITQIVGQIGGFDFLKPGI